MPTILLEQIIALLTDWKDSFFIWANAIGDKIASIKTNTDSLPDIKDNTDDIKDNTAAVITPISNINTNVSSISGDTASIRTDAGIIKNNAQAIATSSGQAAAFAQDCADNTLDMKSKITTIASDTTQMRADSGSIRADVSEIKTAMTYYIANTIVTEDASGDIASCDTDLKDYLQNAVVTIPADVGGIAGFDLVHCGANIWDEQWEVGNIQSGVLQPSTTAFRSKNYIECKPNTIYNFVATDYTNCFVFEYDGSKVYTNKVNNVSNTHTFTTGATTKYLLFTCRNSNTYSSGFGINYPSTDSEYHAYNSTTTAITFTSPITDGAEVDLLSGIVKINTSPVTYDSITPLAIRTFEGVNNIYSDIGDIDVTYRETLKHYLEKQQ